MKAPDTIAVILHCISEAALSIQQAKGKKGSSSVWVAQASPLSEHSDVDKAKRVIEA
jgi:hypothetical protein